MTVQEHAHDSARHNPRPAFTQPRLILYVFLGGALGAAGRLVLELLLPWAKTGVPWAIVIANLGGAFILGFLLTALARRGPETPAQRDWRLFAGTGMMGGFTTYSSFATDTATLLGSEPPLAVGYGILGVVLGLVAAALGIWLASIAVPRASAPKGATS
ncbi:MAG: fluoride efflux transporter FluC [Microbacterium sp.]|uniref:fluoride efflux transporter FluC n=1 Tax=Microbacterium sp. TaxID=51671 RepID=UPI003A847AAB